MEVQCANGHAQTISDPTDEGWEYSYRDRFEPTEVTLPNGETTQIQHRVATPVSRRLVWKCAAPTEADNPQSPLCGLVAVVEEEIAQPAVEEPVAATPEGGNG
jgi:hypothetical protein